MSESGLEVLESAPSEAIPFRPDDSEDANPTDDLPSDDALLDALLAGLGLAEASPTTTWLTNQTESSPPRTLSERKRPQRAKRRSARSGPADDSSSALNLYLTEVRKIPLLRADDEVELGKDIEAGLYAEHLLSLGNITSPGRTQPLRVSERRHLMSIVRTGKSSYETMLRSNLRLVVYVARRYQGHGLDLLDLIQDGNIGLIRAVQKYDYSKGYKFSTYAMWWIRQAITRGLADTSRTIRLPVHFVEQLHRVKSQISELPDENVGRQEISERLDLPIETVNSILDHSRVSFSLEQEVRTWNSDLRILWRDVSDSRVPLKYILDYASLDSDLDDLVARQAIHSAIERVFSCLTDREVAVIRLRFGFYDGNYRTLEEIGMHFGLTRERIRQIEKKALDKLRSPDRKAFLAEHR